MKNEKPTKIAFLWDESFLWGLMAYKALKDLGLHFDLVRAQEIQDGVLDGCKMLFVPGGWASNKSKSLGAEGRSAIQQFVESGGSYLGFCGGAGLATKAKGGIGLLNVSRRPTRERVPSFSGRIEINISEHMIWNGMENSASHIFNAWWPSQFIVEDKSVNVLATYGDAHPDSFSSDLNVGDTEAHGGWKGLEEIYGINLDPERLKGEPAIIEGIYGKGKVVLSLLHFDTPDDNNGHQMLSNLWEYLGGQDIEQRAKNKEQRLKKRADGAQKFSRLEQFKLYSLANDLTSLGERNFLWFWRTPMFLQWRRGVRGFEYNTLHIMIKEIAEILQSSCLPEGKAQDTDSGLIEIEIKLIPFLEKAKRLLLLERHALQRGHITYEKCEDEEIREIRTELFSNSKSYGGQFKELLDEVNDLLFSLINRKEN